MKPSLSVIVPLYNTADYMNACLESIVLQNVENLQVILVNDGSPDESGVIAQEWRRRDERFVLIEQENRGLSAARNVGVAAARGEFLAFCDADDLVASGSYTRLLRSLHATGSDFATGDVRRFNQSGTWPHEGYGDLFAETRARTHISTYPALVRDRMVWNKVFRADFWHAHDLKFELPLYEDAPVMITAHIKARSVDVLSDVVYRWRVRDSGPASTTQARDMPHNALGFMTMVLETFDVIRSLQPSVMGEYVHVMCIGDVADLLQILRSSDPRDFRSAIEAGLSFVSQIPSRVRAQLPEESRNIIADLLTYRDFTAAT